MFRASLNYKIVQKVKLIYQINKNSQIFQINKNNQIYLIKKNNQIISNPISISINLLEIVQMCIKLIIQAKILIKEYKKKINFRKNYQNI